jgi:hypothetical protein
MVPTAHRIFGVDIPADLQAVEPLLRQDPFTGRYLVVTGAR